MFTCEHCGFSQDRDLNAAINLKTAVSHPVSACGSGEADFSKLKQEDFSLLANVSKL
ncbi:zinc ribbon domain-containing protein [Phormidesmis sp. 146-12]